MCIYEIPDMAQGTLVGVIKALGIQDKVVNLTLMVYWLMQLPLCYILVFQFDLGVFGFWVAMLMALSFMGCSFQYVIWNSDWEQAAREAKERTDDNNHGAK